MATQNDLAEGSFCCVSQEENYLSISCMLQIRNDAAPAAPMSHKNDLVSIAL